MGWRRNSREEHDRVGGGQGGEDDGVHVHVVVLVVPELADKLDIAKKNIFCPAAVAKG